MYHDDQNASNCSISVKNLILIAVKPFTTKPLVVCLTIESHVQCCRAAGHGSSKSESSCSDPASADAAMASGVARSLISSAGHHRSRPGGPQLPATVAIDSETTQKEAARRFSSYKFSDYLAPHSQSRSQSQPLVVKFGPAAFEVASSEKYAWSLCTACRYCCDIFMRNSYILPNYFKRRP